MPASRSSSHRRYLIPLVLGPLTALLLLLSGTAARADTASTLTVDGTSDVSDSGLMPNVIMPQFEKAFPQYAFKYNGSATGVAIQNSESGSGGPSALIVHAPSLENQFVAGGYSYNNQFGSAIFMNDFVLAGPNADPAGVAANAANNVARAFADVAAAGAAGKAAFISRGGAATAPGTTVEEHQIWALVASAGLQPSSLSLCVVSATDGGGMSPVNNSALNNQPCPDSGTVVKGHNPSWYVISGLTQGPNVQAADTCTQSPAGASTCYVLTDRGTFDYLASGTDPAGSLSNLKIVTRGPQSASAPGGPNALVNYFHVYIINPSKPGETVNLQAAQAFVTFLTSQAFQAQLKTYLAKTSDPAGPPFIATASPSLTASGIPHAYHADKPVKVTGTLTNAETGFPALSGVRVTVDEVKGALTVPVASAKTDSSGHYSIKFVPPATGSYQVSTGQISQIENAMLSPRYGDILSPAVSAPVKVTVRSATANFAVKSQGGQALVLGRIVPGDGHVKGIVSVFARAVGPGTHPPAFKKLAGQRLAASQGNFAISVPLAAGSWEVKVKFTDPRQVVAATSRTVRVTIAPKPASRVSLRSVRTRTGGFTLSGVAAPAGETGAKVELLALDAAPGAPTRFRVLGTVTLGAGKTTFTFREKAKHGTRWVLQLEYVRPGQTSSFSGLRTAAVR